MSDINFDELTDKSFYFLVEEYSFKRKGDTYISDSAVIKIKYGRHQPHVTIKPVSEPDFTALGLNWFFDYYIDEFDFSSIRDIDLETATMKFSTLFKKHADIIVTQIQDWWFPAQKYRLETIEKDFGEKPEMFNELYEYVDKTKNIEK